MWDHTYIVCCLHSGDYQKDSFKNKYRSLQCRMDIFTSIEKNAPNKYLKKCGIHKWCRIFLYLTTTSIILSNQFREQTKISLFRVLPVLYIKTRLSALKPLIWKWFFILMQTQHKKGCALGLVLKVRISRTWKRPIKINVISHIDIIVQINYT